MVVPAERTTTDREQQRDGEPWRTPVEKRGISLQVPDHTIPCREGHAWFDIVPSVGLPA